MRFRFLVVPLFTLCFGCSDESTPPSGGTGTGGSDAGGGTDAGGGGSSGSVDAGTDAGSGGTSGSSSVGGAGGAGGAGGSGGSADGGPPELPGTPISQYGCVCDGSTDDSACLQAAVDDAANWMNRTLEWPVGATCISVNTVWAAPTGDSASPFILRGHGSVLKAPDGYPVTASSPWNPVLRINGGQWLVLDDLDFDGNRDTRTPLEVPAHNVLVMSSRDVLIRNMDSMNAVADGLYIASSVGADLDSRPQRITVRNPVVTRSYRNNISIINCDGCTIQGDGNGKDSTCKLTDAQGTPPQAGIDLEPNLGNAIPGIENAMIDGCYIARNYGTAVLLHNAANPKNITVKNNLMEGDRVTVRPTCGAAMHLGSDQVVIEDNVFQNFNIPVGCRALFDFGAVGGKPAAATIRNNRIETIRGIPDIAHVFQIHPANQGGHVITGNTLVDIEVAADGDWCFDGSSTVANDIRDNTVDGVVQSPNPGCP